MKKTTTKKLSKKLLKYGALTAAFSGITDASGQITYTDVSPDFSGSNTGSYGLDLNNDGIIDFNLNGSSSASLFLEPTTTNNSFLGSAFSFYAYPFNLTNGANISSGQTSWTNNGAASLNYNSCSYGNFCTDIDGFLGLRFTLGGNLHYGWVRLDTNADSSFTVKDYAFNMTPGAPLTAGEQTLSVDDLSINNIRIVALNKSIGLYNLPSQTTYRLFDITGKQVLNGSSNQSVHVIKATNVANGVFILEIEDKNTKSIIRKKLVL